MKILYTTTIGLTMNFFRAYIRQLLDAGHTVDIATNESDYKVDACYKEWGCNIFSISWSRSPYKKGNVTAIRELEELFQNNKYDIVHCHTPIASACTRYAARRVKNGLKVIYTAHGFHFYKGAPILNWLLFYPLEKICAHWTDMLITINAEDYLLATKHLGAKQVKYVPGVGIDLLKVQSGNKTNHEIRTEIGVPQEAYLLLSVGELNKNKNHEIVIRAISELADPIIHYVIAGKGEYKEYLLELSRKYNVEDQIHLIGYRKDINEIYGIADVFVLPSLREGLNVSTMEAMANGLPCIVSRIRGNVDLIDNEGGICCRAKCVEDYANAITEIRKRDRKEIASHNKKKVEGFSEKCVFPLLNELYTETLGNS